MSRATNKPASVRVALDARGYDILVGQNLLAAAGEYLRPLASKAPIFIVTDETVAEHHLGTLEAGLKAAGLSASAIPLPPGEGTKDFAHLESLTARLLDARVERDSLLIALGGGVVGDLAGFAASITLRGIAFVQMPTTLLAQVDSAIGGKTGINAPQGKNLLGSFYQPRLVLSDLGALATLPQREFLSGYAEVVKYGLINDAAFFAWLEANGPALLARDPDALRHAVVTASTAKAAIVAADEREANARALLNLGHTFGHAYEAVNGFSPDLQHGEAVALGMCLAFALSERLGLCPAEDAARVRNHLGEIGLPTTPADIGPGKWDAGALLDRMRQDKKIRDGQLRFVLAQGIGKAFLHEALADEEVLRFLKEV